MEQCSTNLVLSDVLDQYMMLMFNDKKTYAANFLLMAKLAWKEIFGKTFFSTRYAYVTVEHDEHGYYIIRPKDCIRVLSVSVNDECGRHALALSDIPIEATVIPKGKCNKCDSDLCSIIDSNVITRTEIFNGVSYVLKTYLDRLSNGDIIEVNEVLEYDTVLGKTNKVLKRKPMCKLDVYECGCPKPTLPNRTALKNCGCNCLGMPICCDPCEKPLIANKYGYVNWTMESNKIRLKVSDVSLPKMLILALQSNGESNVAELQVPEYSLATMFEGINFFASFREHPSIKAARKLSFEESKMEMAMFLAPFSAEAFRKLQGITPKW